MKILDVASRKEILRKNKLCFNCTGYGHLATNSTSRGCNLCGGRHHTSLCDKRVSTLAPGSNEKKEVLGALCDGTTLHPTVVAHVQGEEVRIMMDSGAGSSYICTELVTKLKLKPLRKERKNIEQMYGTVNKLVEIYKMRLTSMSFPEFSINVECTSAEKNILTYLPNPNIDSLKKMYPRIRRLKFSDEMTQNQKLPIHIILGAADYQRIKTTEPSILGKNPDKDPGAELTMFGWILAGKVTNTHSETDKNFFTKSSRDEFERMCAMDSLGILETNEEQFHEDFKENLQRLSDGKYSTRLPWKTDCPELPSNNELAMGRLRSTTRRLERLGRLKEYHEIMKQQLEDGILEPVPEKPTGDVIHYIPHQAVIRDEAETTRLRIVYDCSAKKGPAFPSLNDCLEIGPSLQPMIFDIMLRNRMKKYCITGDIKKVFLQIKVDPVNRDAQRLFWYEDLDEKTIVAYRFTRVIFGSGPSPYILGATLEKHVNQFMDKYPATVKDLLENTYVDDVQTVGDQQEELERFKKEAVEIMKDGGFSLHKWHSSFPELEANDAEEKAESEELTFAKEIVGTETHETRILGLPWNTKEDTFKIEFSKCWKDDLTYLMKRKMLSVVNRMYDLLGLASPVIITGKILYSRVCLLKLQWDEEVPQDIKGEWNKWITTMKKRPYITVPRNVVTDKVEKICIHGFSDASKLALAAAVYIEVISPKGIATQRLLVSKSRIAPKDISIPRLELVAAHLLSRLMNHVKESLHNVKIDEFHAWVDSTTVLYWLEDKGTWAQFVRNRTKKIKEYNFITWHYVPTAENPSDLGSRGVAPEKLNEFWFCGPSWLTSKIDWPEQPEIFETEEARKERLQKKLEKGMMMKEEFVKSRNRLFLLMDKCSSYWKLLRTTAFIKRFIVRCRGKELESEEITADEIDKAEETLVKITQQTMGNTSDVRLEPDGSAVLRCCGRIQDYNPIFIPRKSELVTLLVKHYHKKTLHGGVSLTMNSFRERFWTPRLRSIVKSIIHRCEKCKRYRVKPVASPPAAKLPEFRVKMIDPFNVTGVDFAGPMAYKVKKGHFGKVYVALFTWASTRAVHLKLCHDLTAVEFQRALKEFVARRGCPNMMVSDNGKTFASTAKWLSILKKDEDLMSFMAQHHIKWRFNLSRSPWWGGFFERLIGIMKRMLSKVIGNALLSFAELEEVLLDVECCMNNRPLCYIEQEFEEPVLTPNILLRGKSTPVLDEDLQKLNEDESTTRRLKYLLKGKEHLRRRFLKEYVHTLEERQLGVQGSDIDLGPKIGSIVIIKGDTKDKTQWKLGRVIEKIIGKDGVVRGVKLKLGNGYVVERPFQMICDLEITSEAGEQKTKLNPNADAFIPERRSTRKAKTMARDQMKAVVACEEKEI